MWAPKAEKKNNNVYQNNQQLQNLKAANVKQLINQEILGFAKN